MEITVYSDPGHAWAKVPTMVLVQLGIVDKISGCSYLDDYGRTAYLEEDCDLGVFMRAMEALDQPVTFHEVNQNTDSFIRNLPRFTI